MAKKKEAAQPVEQTTLTADDRLVHSLMGADGVIGPPDMEAAPPRLVRRFGDRRFARMIRGELARDVMAHNPGLSHSHASFMLNGLTDADIADAADNVLSFKMASGDFTEPPEKLIAGGVFDSILDFLRNLDPEFKKAVRDFILKLLGLIA